MKSGLQLVLILISRFYTGSGLQCSGLTCENGGILTHSTDGDCTCNCLPGNTGILCEYEIRESQFPNGAFALQMSKYGCPEGPEQGWGIGYINITTQSPLHDPKSYPKKCQKFVMNYKKTLNWDNPMLRTSILGPFDQYTLQLNFCYKLHVENSIVSTRGWFDGIYGVFGSRNGCPMGLKESTLALCLPPFLHDNTDGHVPHFDKHSVAGGTELHFTYCRHEFDNNVDTLDIIYPFMVIKDPYETGFGCPQLHGYSVSMETFPVPVPVIVQSRSNHTQDEDLFQLQYCHIFPHDDKPRTFNNTFPMEYSILFAVNEGFPGTAHSFIDITTVNYKCENMTYCSTTKISNCNLLYDCGIVQSWIFIDVRREILVSAIMITASETDFLKFSVELAHILVSNQKWDVLNDGALLCSDQNEEERFEFFHVWLCKKPLRGRYVTLISHPHTTDIGEGKVSIQEMIQKDRAEDAWKYSRTIINILAYDLNEVLTMHNKFLNEPALNVTIREVVSALSYTDIRSKSCKQELGVQDYGIWDSQFTSSSWQPFHLPSNVRPQSSGWCADYSDKAPFLQVDLIYITLVDGFIILNWHEIINFKENNVYLQDVIRSGASSFLINYGTSLQTMKNLSRDFISDMSRKPGGEETFILSEPFIARFLRLYPRRFPESSFPCLKIEILGCRTSDYVSLQCPHNTTKEISSVGQIYVPADKPGQEYANMSVIDCEQKCLYKEPGCISMQYVENSSSCTLYSEDLIQNYALMTSDSHKDSLSMVTCLVDKESSLDGRMWLTEEIDFTWFGFITNIGYPFTYSYGSAYRWKLNLNTPSIMVRFMEISLRSFEETEKAFVNNINCRDSIILKAYARDANIRDPFSDFNKVDDFDLYGDVTSDQNGQTPAFPMGHYPHHQRIFQNSQNVSYWHRDDSFTDVFLYIIFYSCSSGNALNLGRGFRLHVSVQEPIICAEYHIPTMCVLPEMDIISNRFLGQVVEKDQTWDIVSTGTGQKSILMILEFVDFDISCFRESSLKFTNEFRETFSYCNGNRPFGIVSHLAGRYTVTFVSNRLQSEMDDLFREGFRLSYRFVPQNETLPQSLLLSSAFIDGQFGKVRVCVGALQKCYLIQVVNGYAWESVYRMCKKEGMTMVNLKTMDEMAILKSVLLDFNRQRSAFNIPKEILIGLTRDVDSSGVMHEYWSDGSPLSFTAWDEGEPSDITLKRCTKMDYHRPSVNDTWKTLSCYLKQSQVLAVCEKKDTIKSGTKQGKLLNINTENDTFLRRDNSTLFKCASGEWTSALASCNNIAECLDSSDEINCRIADNKSCTDDEFKCPDGRCIHISLVCDFKVDCIDDADEFCEYPVCPEDSCANGQCIQVHERCNSIENCFDGSDEINCEVCSSTETFQCLDRSCIPSYLVCDLVNDCADGADEMSCDQDYTTCEDFLNNGILQSGYFQINKEYFIHCNFENITNGGELLHMTLPSIDRKQLTSDSLSVTTAGLTNAFDKSFNCSQKIGIYPQRETEEAMLLDGKEIRTENYEFHFFYKIALQEFSTGVGVTISTNYTSYDIRRRNSIDKTYGRIKVLSAECKKSIPQQEHRIHCRHGALSVNQSYRCLYDKGWKDIIKGCRSLAHLQNCSRFTCPQDYIKCPSSYCIPLQYLCNGNADCPDGYDEQLCECDYQDRSIVIVFPDATMESRDGSYLSYLVNKLGGSLFTTRSNITILKTDFYYVLKTYPFPSKKMDAFIHFDRSVVMMTSQYTMEPTERLSVKARDIKDFLKGLLNEEGKSKVTAVIWLMDETIMENETFSLVNGFHNMSLADHFNYLVVKDTNLWTDVAFTGEQFVKTVRMRELDVLSTVGNKFFPEICNGSETQCKGRYRCIFSRICIPMTKLCDGTKQCPTGDDESNCDFKCPSLCSCRTLIMNCSYVNTSDIDLKKETPTRILDASNSPTVCRHILESNETRSSFKLLISLKMSACKIKYISMTSFEFSPNLKRLDLSFNEIKVIPSYAFSVLKVLEILLLEGNNKLRSIEPQAFYGILIRSLTIRGTKIRTLHSNTFNGLALFNLDLTHNQIVTVKDGTFNSLESANLDIRFNPIKDFFKHMFEGLTRLKQLKTSAFKFCCIRPSDLNEDDCYPHKDEFSSCEDLMRNSTLQALMWTIGILAFIGNVLSVIYRLIYDKKRLKLGYGIFVTNLAVADLMMGVYMLIIAVADKLFRNRYIEVDEYWRNSFWCKMSGVISTVSSEASVLFMCLITIDRILIIKYPFGQIRFKERSATTAVGIVWVFVVLISFLPIAYTGYFKGQFYSKSGVCLALPLTRDRQPGWLYSILLFIGFNMVTFIMIAVGQLLIYFEIKKASSAQKALTTTRTNDLKVARNLLLVVTTDFLCWFPIGMMGCLALTGHVIPGEVYAWTAVFVLPINSALNPFMYTLTAIYSSKKFSPSVDEQSRLDPSKEMGKAILEIFPFIPTCKVPDKYAVLSLREWCNERKLLAEDVIYLLHYIVNFLNVSHGYQLVLRAFTEDNIYVVVLRNKRILQKAYIDVQLYQSVSSNKKEMAEDICKFGNLADRILNLVVAEKK